MWWVANVYALFWYDEQRQHEQGIKDSTRIGILRGISTWALKIEDGIDLNVLPS
jgi:hypothetical protein